MRPLYLIAYDIADPRRLGRIHRFLTGHALAVQYSVFVAPCSDASREGIVAGLRQRMHPGRDDIRLYRLPDHCEPQTLGRQWLPPDVLLGTDPALKKLQAGESGMYAENEGPSFRQGQEKS